MDLRRSSAGIALTAALAALGCSSSSNGGGDEDASPGVTAPAQDAGNAADGAAVSPDAATSKPPATDGSSPSDATSSFDAGSSPDAASSGSGGGSDAATGDGSTCRPQFSSGVNVAWINYASDVPVQSGELAKFDTLFANVYSAGGRAVRWWFHTNGTVTPGYDSDGTATQISAANIADVKSILDHAHAAGVGVIISLWGFDMLQAVGTQNITQTVLTNNTNLLTVAADRNAYVTKVLTPLVTALKGYPGLYAWEVFNEPEGMTTQNGWTPNKVDESVVQTCVNVFAAAIHAADPSALVTNGTWTFIANSHPTGGSYTNDYSDTALTADGGLATGTLDFYEVHYYDNWGPSSSANGASAVVSPFTHNASYWNTGDSKPIVIGEFYAIETNGVPAADLYTNLYDGGYGGGWAWQYENADNPPPSIDLDGALVPVDAGTVWPAMQVPMQNLLTAHPSAVTCP
jgi:hypothetical protein